jgi:hypothetical protein
MSLREQRGLLEPLTQGEKLAFQLTCLTQLAPQ